MPRNTKPHRNAEVDFKGEKRSNVTHASITDPDARLYKKSQGIQSYSDPPRKDSVKLRRQLASRGCHHRFTMNVHRP